MKGNPNAARPSVYHFLPDVKRPRSVACGAPWTSAPWDWATSDDYDGPEPTGLTDDPEQVTCPECREAFTPTPTTKKGR